MNPGGKRWRIVLVILAAAVLAVVVYHFIAGRGPKYQGRTVSYWFEEYCRSGQFMRFDEMRHEEADDALRHLGTNAVPYLIEEAFNTNRDSQARSNYIRFLQSLPRSWGFRVPVTAEARVDEGSTVLGEIKPPANMIFPFLESQYRTTNPPPNFSRRQAVIVMGCLGDGAEVAVPDLMAALQDPDSWTQLLAVTRLDELGPKAAAAVPALVSYMETNSRYAASAAGALGSIGVNDPEAVRMIWQKFETETNWYSRCHEATALCRIDAAQTNALNFLVNEFETNRLAGNPWYLAGRLSSIGTNAAAAVPALTEILKATEDSSKADVWEATAQALRGIGVPSQTLVEEFRPALHAKDMYLRANAAGQIMALEPSDRESHEVLIAVIQDSPPLQLHLFAMGVLAKAGWAARDAIPALEEVSKSKEPDVAEAAKIGVRRIEADEGGK